MFGLRLFDIVLCYRDPPVITDRKSWSVGKSLQGYKPVYDLPSHLTETYVEENDEQGALCPEMTKKGSLSAAQATLIACLNERISLLSYR